jgi:hypothetical protein
VTTDDDLIKTLEKRLGRLHARQRLGIETDHEAQVFGQGLNFFHIENLRSSHFLIRMALMMTGLYRRGLSNAKDVQLRQNYKTDPVIVPPVVRLSVLPHLHEKGVVYSRCACPQDRPPLDVALPWS